MPQDELISLNLRLERKTRLADDVVQLDFMAIDGVELPPWAPGGHLELRLPSGIVRHYSLCGDPQNRDTYTVAVLREAGGRGGSIEIHDQLTNGDIIESSGPRNHFPLIEAADYVLLAGGIGITPIKAMADELDRRGASWRLVYGGRTRQSMAYADELAASYPKRVTLLPQDEAGRPDLVNLLGSFTAGTHLFCCGPGPMLTAVTEACSQAGLTDRLHFERFSAPDQPAIDTSGDGAFEVELQKTGVTISVGAGQSILEAIRSAGPNVPSSCQEGYCGTCETRVICGQPEHRGTLMSPEEHDEEGTMLICVGRSRSPKLVLDL